MGTEFLSILRQSVASPDQKVLDVLMPSKTSIDPESVQGSVLELLHELKLPVEETRCRSQARRSPWLPPGAIHVHLKGRDHIRQRTTK